jgi:L-lysine exporter family protein LysE/ArgO
MRMEFWNSDVFVQGMAVSAGLIVAIGAQNAFVLRQGLLGRQVLAVVLTCFFCDFVLMALGVLGLGALVADSPAVTVALALFGAAYLLRFALLSWRAAYSGSSALEVDAAPDDAKRGLWLAVRATLAVSLLNPHVYLDTVVLLGAVAATVQADQKLGFMAGAVSASFLWFMALGFGARLLRPLFKQPRTWQLLDAAIGLVMLSIAAGLLQFAWERWPY